MCKKWLFKVNEILICLEWENFLSSVLVSFFSFLPFFPPSLIPSLIKIKLAELVASALVLQRNTRPALHGLGPCIPEPPTGIKMLHCCWCVLSLVCTVLVRALSFALSPYSEYSSCLHCIRCCKWFRDDWKYMKWCARDVCKSTAVWYKEPEQPWSWPSWGVLNPLPRGTEEPPYFIV